MPVTTSADIFADYYSKETGIDRNRIMMAVFAVSRTHKIDIRGVLSGFPKEDVLEISNAYRVFRREMQGFPVMRNAGRTTLLAETEDELNSWLCEQKNRKEKILPHVKDVAMDFIYSFPGYMPDMGFLMGSSTMESKTPVFYEESGGKTFMFSDIDVGIVYPEVDMDLVWYALDAARKISLRQGARVDAHIMNYDTLMKEHDKFEGIYISPLLARN